MAGTLMNLPFQLRANDVQRYIINVDSRFRDAPSRSTPANFYYTLQRPIRNVLRIRITSFEFPNTYYMFTECRKNITIRVIYKNLVGVAVGSVVTIAPGNYTAFEMEAELNQIFQSSTDLTWITVSFDPISGHFVFTGTQHFAIDTNYECHDRDFDYGLAYYLGFTRILHKSVSNGAGQFTVESDMCANFAGDSYILMRLNDYKCVRHNTGAGEMDIFAKFVLKDPKNNVAFDDYGGHHIKEIVLPGPQDLSRLKVQIMDAYGHLINLCNTNFSFSLEILEIKNLNLYTAIRDSLAIPYLSPGPLVSSPLPKPSLP